jgi:phosphoribosyl 1,2-cyclic phosphate phosphodiesterase
MVWHLKMPVLGFRFEKFSYITDANRIEEAEQKKIKGSDYLTLNALRREPHISHFNLSEGVEMANKLGIPQTYFTHLSHQMGLHDDINKQLPQHMSLAYDGLMISL